MTTFCYGAGINNVAGAVAILTDSLVADNGPALSGGGIYVDADSRAQLVRTEVTGNIASPFYGGVGGGLHSDGTLTLTDSLVTRNQATPWGGGAGLYSRGVAIISGTTFEGNRARIGGGIDSAGTRTMTASAVAGNTAELGSGLYIRQGDVELRNVTISGNIASPDVATSPGCGGGILRSSGAVHLHAVTVTDNACLPATGSGRGGGIDGQSGIRVHESLVAGNHIGTAPAWGADCVGELFSEGYNLLGDSDGCTFSGAPTGNLVDVDPRLGPLDLHGGRTPVHPLLPGSPAIDAGDPGSPLVADGLAIASPHLHTPAAAPLSFYQVDDGAGLPQRIWLVAAPSGKIRIYF